MTNYSSAAVFCPSGLFSVLFSFFLSSVSGNEARFRARMAARWRSSRRCAVRAGPCHSPWVRLMITDRRGTNWTSEDPGGGREAGPTGTLFAGPLHLSAAARSSPALTVSTGLWVDDQDPLIYGLSSLLLSELCWPKFCYWQKDEVLFVFCDLRAPPSALHHRTTRNGSLIFALICLSLSLALSGFQLVLLQDIKWPTQCFYHLKVTKMSLKSNVKEKRMNFHLINWSFNQIKYIK